ncbi:MAG: transposase [Sulfurovum sp.]|nr:transposase [Sulfurovum sp.]
MNLFSTDVTLDYEKVIDYYSLRFQIEFVFRDAKQYWGMEDSMNIRKYLSIIGQISLLLWSISLMDYAKILI